MPIFFYAKRPQGFQDVPVSTLSAKTLEEVLTKPEELVGKLEASERWDLYYGVAQVSEHRRGDPKDPATGKVLKSMQGSWANENWKRQEVLLWDLDSISEDDRGKVEAYQEIIARVLKVDPEQMTIVSSGHGFHFILFLKEPITDWKFFHKNRVFYRAILDLIETGLKAAGLTGKADPAVFDHNRVMRMPLTENRKREPHQLAKVLQTSVHKHELNLQALSGMPLVTEGDVLEPDAFRLRRLDVQGIQDECVVLRWTKEKPETVKEPLGYAALSVLGRLDKTKAIAKTYYNRWTNSTSLMQADPERKIEQALEASGPATCARFSNLSEGCKECKWAGKITSPILIQGENFVETEEDGFWREYMSNGRLVSQPAYGDMLKVFIRERHYFLKPETDTIWYWSGTHYKKAFEAELRNWAEEKADPQLSSSQRAEFIAKLKSNKLLSDPQFEPYRLRTRGFFNMRNGVLDTRTGAILPHDPQRGFKTEPPEYDYDPKATCPKFDEFLDTIMLGNKELVATVWDMLGASLLPGYDEMEPAFWWLYGAGSNGKTTLVRLHSALLGAANCFSLQPENFKPTQRFALASLDGKMLAITEEVNDKHLGDDMLGTLKNLSSGGVINVEEKNKPHYNMRNTAKFVMTSNKSPVLEDVTVGLQRRFIFIPFDANFEDPEWAGRKDTQILPKLLSELPGILNGALRALDLLRKRNGHALKPEASKRELEQLVLSSDSVERWASENVRITNNPADFILSREAHAAYEMTMGNERKASETTFVTRLKKKTNSAIRGMPNRPRINGVKHKVIWGMVLEDRDDGDASF